MEEKKFKLIYEFDRDYMSKMAEEINEMLQERESVSVSELTNAYELPADFIHQVNRPLFFTTFEY